MLSLLNIRALGFFVESPNLIKKNDIQISCLCFTTNYRMIMAGLSPAVRSCFYSVNKNSTLSYLKNKKKRHE